MKKYVDGLSYNDAELLGSGSFGNVFVGKFENMKVACSQAYPEDRLEQ